MSVKSRDLASQVYYVFNGTDFIISKNIDEADYRKILKCCSDHDPDSCVKEKSPADKVSPDMAPER